MPAFNPNIIPALVMLFWTVRIFVSKDSRRMQLLMAAGMLVGALALFSRDVTSLFIAPFFFLSIRDVTAQESRHRWDWTVILPSILMIPLGGMFVCRVFLLVQVLLLMAYLIWDVARYNKLMAEYFDTGSDSSDGLCQLVLYLAATVIVTAVMLMLPDEVTSVPWVSLVFCLFIAVLQFLLGHGTYHLQEFPKISGEVCQAESAGVDTAAAPEPEDVPEFRPMKGTENVLLQRAIDEKLYLDSKISLVSLAEALKTNRTYLSKSIHDCYDRNFSDFINNLRIQHALELMRGKGPDVNIKEVAIQSGYNHLQSFYRNFELIMDMTPKEWISRQSKQSR